MLEAGCTEQSAFFPQQLDDDRIGFEDGQVFVGKPRLSAMQIGVALLSGVIDILHFGQIVAFAGVEVVDAMGGRGVDGSGALLGGDVVGE